VIVKWMEIATKLVSRGGLASSVGGWVKVAEDEAWGSVVVSRGGLASSVGGWVKVAEDEA
jgi:hypothetical protein